MSTVARTDLSSFSFHTSPVLIVEDFWSVEDRQYFLEAMKVAPWKHLQELSEVREDFPNSGNWAKAELESEQAKRFLSQLELPCIREYMESFPDIVGHHLGFSYYSYAAGDCLLTHDDTDQGRPSKGRRASLRRLALVTYFHEEWRSDWGGELILYTKRPRHSSENVDLVPAHCIEPRPGSLVMFTVPRFHRVCRVDPMAGQSRRLSIAGWFMTEHTS